jgi:hypothetical protein
MEVRPLVACACLLAHFPLKKNLEFRWNVKCQRQGWCKQECHKVRSSPLLFSIYVYINYTPQTYGVHLALFADNTCLYATGRKECFVIRKLQRGLSSVETGVRTGILKLMRRGLRGSTSLVVVDRLSLTANWLLGWSGRDICADSLYFLYVVLDSICCTFASFQHILWPSSYVYIRVAFWKINMTVF